MKESQGKDQERSTARKVHREAEKTQSKRKVSQRTIQLQAQPQPGVPKVAWSTLDNSMKTGAL